MQSHLQIEEHNFLQYEIFKWSSIDKTECNVKKKKISFVTNLPYLSPALLLDTKSLRYPIILFAPSDSHS